MKKRMKLKWLITTTFTLGLISVLPIVTIACSDNKEESNKDSSNDEENQNESPSTSTGDENEDDQSGESPSTSTNQSLDSFVLNFDGYSLRINPIESENNTSANVEIIQMSEIIDSIKITNSYTNPANDFSYAINEVSISYAEEDGYNSSISYSVSDFEINAIKVTDYFVYDKPRDKNSLVKITESLTLNVEEIGDYAFYAHDFTSDVNVTFNGVKTINSYAFSYCQRLNSIILDDSIDYVGNCAFLNCQYIKSFYLGSSVRYIGNSAFKSCGLYSDVDDSIQSDLSQVEYIGDGAFYAAKVYFSITSQKLNELNLTSNTFQSSYLTKIIIPDNIETIPSSAFYWCTKLESVYIPNSVVTIKESAFFDCWNLTDVTIPDSVNSLSYYTFRNCYSLVSITLPSLQSWNYGTFYNCTSLESVIFADNCQLTTIPSTTFYNCSSLTSIVIPKSITSLGNQCFYCCSGLSSVTLPTSFDNEDEDLSSYFSKTSDASGYDESIFTYQDV